MGWLDHWLLCSQREHRCVTRSNVPIVVVSTLQWLVQAGHLLKSSISCSSWTRCFLSSCQRTSEQVLYGTRRYIPSPKYFNSRTIYFSGDKLFCIFFFYLMQFTVLALSLRWELGLETDTSHLCLFRGVVVTLIISGWGTSIKEPVSQYTLRPGARAWMAAWKSKTKERTDWFIALYTSSYTCLKII